MYKCGAVFKGETVQIKKNKIERIALNLTVKIILKKTSEEIQPRLHVQVTERH